MALGWESRLGSAFAGVVVVFAVAGCGGSESLTAQQLVAKGDAICRELRATAPRAPTSLDLGAIARYADQAYGPARRALQRFRRLKPRQADRRVYAEFVAAGARRTEDVRLLGDAARAGNAQAVKAVARKQEQDAVPYRRAAQQLGFRVCGSGVTATKGR
jgi:hypothetical protein